MGLVHTEGYGRQMSTTIEFGGRDAAHHLIPEVSTWAPSAGAVVGLHVGDLGWHLRMDDRDLDGTVVAVLVDGQLVAAGLYEPDGVRLAIRPDRVNDRVVAEAIADLAETTAAEDAFADVPTSPLVDDILRDRGWRTDPHAWAILYRPLTAADAEPAEPPGVTTLKTEQDVADRVAVQFAAFTGSTFTVARWHQMASSPAHDPALEFLARTAEDEPAAGATAWSAGPGRAGILEPVGTHPDHRRQGHGRAVSLAAVAALARAGASGVGVQTPEANTAAVATYLDCGLEHVASVRALLRPRP